MKHVIKWILFLSFCAIFFYLLLPIFLFQWHGRGWNHIRTGLEIMFGIE